MLRKIIFLTGLLFMLIPAAFAEDLTFNDYYSYDPGFYDSTDSTLYNANDDWFYDSYVWNPSQKMQDINDDVMDTTYDWEADSDLFDGDVI